MPPTRTNVRATTAKVKKQVSPSLPKDREQGTRFFATIISLFRCMIDLFNNTYVITKHSI